MSDETKWNFEEFTTFLLLYAANADMELSQEEEELIKNRISEESYEAIKSEFDQSNDYQQIQTILQYKGLYFPTEARARELMTMVKDIFNVDGNFSNLEKSSLTVLKRLI
jgi:hypothetical protein